MDLYDPPSAAVIVVSTTAITGGTDTRVLFDDGGKIGESAAFTYTKASGLLASTALALGGATIGTNALAVTGGVLVTGSANVTANMIVGSAIVFASSTNLIPNGNGLLAITQLNQTTGATIDASTAGTFKFRNLANNADAAITAGAGTFSGAVTVPGAAVAALTSTGTFTSGAAASVGTLTNAPSAGNPTSWIKIVDNGVTRFIPAW